MVNKETLWMMCIETHAPNLGHLILAKAFLPSIPASEPVDSPPLCLLLQRPGGEGNFYAFAPVSSLG